MTTAAGAAVLVSVPAQAQQRPTATRAFDIPPQPLPDALVLFGRQAGLEVSAESANTRDRTTQGVSGDLTPAEALSRLLTGTGLTFRWLSGRAVTIEPAPQASGGEGAIMLGPVRVQGEGSTRGGRRAGTPRPPADTRGTYTVPVTGSATKLDLAIKDTPQVVSIITRQRLDDQNLVQVADVMAQAPGVTVQQQGVPGMGQIDYWSRGFPVTNVMFDGVITQAAGNGNFVLWSVLDTAVFDRVEFVQGSTGLASGVGDPSASVNFVRKRPTETVQGEGFLSYGSWDRLRGTVDLSGPLNKSGSLRARVVGAHQAGGTWQDRVGVRMDTLYGIVEADPADNLILTAGITWGKIRVDDAAAFGISSLVRGVNNEYVTPASLGLGRSYNPATQWSFAEVELLNPFAKLEWHISDNWRFNASYMFNDVTQERLTGAIGQFRYDPVADYTDFHWARFQNQGEMHNLDISLSGKFRFLNREHDVVIGMAGYRGHVDNIYAITDGHILFAESLPGLGHLKISEWNNGNVPYPSFGPAELLPGIPNFYTYNPLFSRDIPTGPEGIPLGDRAPTARHHEKQYAPYVAARLRPLDRLQVILGGRRNYWKRWHTQYLINFDKVIESGGIEWPYGPSGEVPGTLSGSYNLKVKGKLTPYAGAIFDITDKVTIYASYTGINRANFFNGGDLTGIRIWSRDKNGDPLPPIEGNSIEIGVKGAFFDNRLNVQLTGYRMKQKNLPYLDPDRDTDEPPPFDPIGGGYTQAMLPGKGVVSQGIEFNIAGQITERINIAFSYSWLDDLKMKGFREEVTIDIPPSGPATVIDREAVEETRDLCMSYYGASNTGPGTSMGTRNFQCPEHSIKVFGTWQATDRLTLGGGINWKSKTGTSVSTPSMAEAYSQGAFAVVDLTARYKVSESFTIGAYLGNVFDKKYLTTQDNWSGFYGPPRNITVSLTGRF